MWVEVLEGTFFRGFGGDVISMLVKGQGGCVDRLISGWLFLGARRFVQLVVGGRASLWFEAGVACCFQCRCTLLMCTPCSLTEYTTLTSSQLPHCPKMHHSSASHLLA